MEHKTLEQSNKSQNAETKSEYDLIDFYLQPEFIKMFSQQLANQPQIDLKKVSQIKQMIKNKSLIIDRSDLSEKIIKFESELFNLINDK